MKLALLKQFKLAVSLRSYPSAWTPAEQRTHREQAGLFSSGPAGPGQLQASWQGWEESKHHCLGMLLLRVKAQAEC